jgi:hypothetical protein
MCSLKVQEGLGLYLSVEPLSNMNKILGSIPGTAAQTCNPSYLGGREQEDLIQGQPRQKVCETPSQPIFLKVGMVVCACYPS